MGVSTNKVDDVVGEKAHVELVSFKFIATQKPTGEAQVNINGPMGKVQSKINRLLDGASTENEVTGMNLLLYFEGTGCETEVSNDNKKVRKQRK